MAQHTEAALGAGGTEAVAYLLFMAIRGSVVPQPDNEKYVAKALDLFGKCLAAVKDEREPPEIPMSKL
jgi:hypothetical protein